MNILRLLLSKIDNKKSYIFFFILLWILTNSASLYAKPPKILRFDNITIKDGLSNPIVYDIVQDKKGFIWIATANGLNRYDGYNFCHYLPDKNVPCAGRQL